MWMFRPITIYKFWHNITTLHKTKLILWHYIEYSTTSVIIYRRQYSITNRLYTQGITSISDMKDSEYKYEIFYEGPQWKWIL